MSVGHSAAETQGRQLPQYDPEHNEVAHHVAAFQLKLVEPAARLALTARKIAPPALDLSVGCALFTVSVLLKMVTARTYSKAVEFDSRVWYHLREVFT